MQIDAIEIFLLELPLREEQTVGDRSFKTFQTVLVRMDSGSHSGWGEASPGNGPVAGSEWAGGAFACLKDWLAPTLCGTDVESGEALQERLAAFQGNPFAKGALDTAWWDLFARIEGKPLCQLLEPARESIELGTSFDQMDSIDALLEALGRAFEEGFARVELKLRPGWDVHMLNAVRHEFPIQTFHVDIEGDLRLDHMEIICRLDDFSLTMVEQPLPAEDLVGHAMVQETIRTPICLDESITSPAMVAMALDLHSAKYINVKPGRIGGITPSIAIHDACHAACVPCYVGGVPQTAIGFRAGLALASKANFLYPTDGTSIQSILERDVAEVPKTVHDASDGFVRIPFWSEPGIGVAVDYDLLKASTLTGILLEGERKSG